MGPAILHEIPSSNSTSFVGGYRYSRRGNDGDILKTPPFLNETTSTVTMQVNSVNSSIKSYVGHRPSPTILPCSSNATEMCVVRGNRTYTFEKGPTPFPCSNNPSKTCITPGSNHTITINPSATPFPCSDIPGHYCINSTGGVTPIMSQPTSFPCSNDPSKTCVILAASRIVTSRYSATRFPCSDDNTMECMSYGSKSFVTTLGPRPSIFPCPGETSKSCSLMAPDNHTMVVGEPYSIYSEALTSDFTSALASQTSSNTAGAEHAPATQARPRSMMLCTNSNNSYNKTITEFYSTTTVVYVSSTASPMAPSTYSNQSPPEPIPSSTSPASIRPSQISPKPTPFPCSGSNSALSRTSIGSDNKSPGVEVVSVGLTTNSSQDFALPKCGPNVHGSCVAIATAEGQNTTSSAPGDPPTISSMPLSHTAQTTPSSSPSITSAHLMPSTGTVGSTLTATPCGPNAGANCVDSHGGALNIEDTHSTLVMQTSEANSASTSLSASTHSANSTLTSHPNSQSITQSVVLTITSGSSRNPSIPRWLLIVCLLGAALAASPAPSPSVTSPPASGPPVPNTVAPVSQLHPSASSTVPIAAPTHGDAEMNANIHVWSMLLEAAHVTVTPRPRPQTTGTSAALVISSTAKGSSSAVNSSLVPKTTTSSSLAKRDPPLSFSMTFQQPSPKPCAGDPEWMCVIVGITSTYSWNPATFGQPPVIATTSTRSSFTSNTSQPAVETLTVVQTSLSTVGISSTTLPSSTQKSASAKNFKVPLLLVLLCLARSVFAVTEPRPAVDVNSRLDTGTNLSDQTLVSSRPGTDTQNSGQSPRAGYVDDPAEIERRLRRRTIMVWAPYCTALVGICVFAAVLARPRHQSTTTQTQATLLANTTRYFLYRSAPGAGAGYALATTQQGSSSKQFIVPVLFMALCFAGSVFASSASLPKSSSIFTAPRFDSSWFDTIPLDQPAPETHARPAEQPTNESETWTVEQVARDRLATTAYLEHKRRLDILRFYVFVALAMALMLCYFWSLIYKASKHTSSTEHVTTHARFLVSTARSFLYRSAPGAVAGGGLASGNTSQSSSAANFKVPLLLMFLCLALPAFAFGQPQSAFGFDQGTTAEHNLGTRTVLGSTAAAETAVEIPMAELAPAAHVDDPEQARQAERDILGNPVVNDGDSGRKKNKRYYIFLVAFFIFLLGFIAAIAVTIVVVLKHRHDPSYRRGLLSRAQPTVVSGTPQGPGNYINSSGSSKILNIPVLLLFTCLAGSVMAVAPPCKTLDFDIPTKNPQWTDFDPNGPIRIPDHNFEDVPLNGMGSPSHAKGQPDFERGSALPVLPPAYEYPALVAQAKKKAWYKNQKNVCILVLIGIILGLCIFLGGIILLRWGANNGNNASTNIVQNPVVSVPIPTVTVVVTSAMSSLQPMTPPTSTRSSLRITSSITSSEISSISTTHAPNPGPNVTGGAMSVTLTGVGVSSPLQGIGGGVANMQAKMGSPIKARENLSEPIIMGAAKEGGMSDATSGSTRTFNIPPWYNLLFLARSITARENLSESAIVSGAKEGGMSDATSGSTRNFNIPSWYELMLLARSAFAKPQDSSNTGLPSPVEVIYHTSIVTAPPVTTTTVQTVFSWLGEYDLPKSASLSSNTLATTPSPRSGNGQPSTSIQGQLPMAGPTAALQESLGFALGYGMQRPLVLLTLCVVVCVVLPLGFWSSGKTRYAKQKVVGSEKLTARAEDRVRKRKREREEGGKRESLNPVSEVKDSFNARLRKSRGKNLKEDENGWIIV